MIKLRFSLRRAHAKKKFKLGVLSMLRTIPAWTKIQTYYYKRTESGNNRIKANSKVKKEPAIRDSKIVPHQTKYPILLHPIPSNNCLADVDIH